MEEKARPVEPQDQQGAKTAASAPSSMPWLRLFGIIGSIGLSVLLFLIALFLPAFNLSNGDTFPAFNAFLIGWLGAFYPPGGLGWYANVFLLAAWLGLAFSRFRISLLSTILGIGLALCSMLLRTIALNERGDVAHITSMGAGFYVWLGSFSICLVAALALIGRGILRWRLSEIWSKP